MARGLYNYYFHLDNDLSDLDNCFHNTDHKGIPLKKYFFILLLFIFTLLFSQNLTRKDELKAKEIYEQHCLICHGESGKGDGIGANSLNPKPVNLTSVKAYKKGSDIDSIIHTINNGTPETPCISFSFLGENNVNLLAQYLVQVIQKKDPLSINSNEEKASYTFSKGDIIRVPATTAISEKFLGMGYDKKFRKLKSKAFHKGGEIFKSEEAKYSSKLKASIIDNYTQLDAFAEFLGLTKADLSQKIEKRFAILSVHNITKSASFIPGDSPNENSDFYLKTIYYGWSINYIISGESYSFNSEVKSNLNTIFNVNFKDSIKEYNLEYKTELIGLELKNKENSEIILDYEQVPKYFKISKVPVPVFLEFESLKDFQTNIINFEDQSKILVSEGKYKISNIFIEVSELNPLQKDNNWDPFGGSPDPFIKIYQNGKFIATSSKLDDKLTGNLKINKTIDLAENDLIQIIVYDEDFEDSDYIGDAWIKFQDIKDFSVKTKFEMKTRNGTGLVNATINFTPILLNKKQEGNINKKKEIAEVNYNQNDVTKVKINLEDWSGYQGYMDWEAAKKKCARIGMRLPTIEELKATYMKDMMNSWGGGGVSNGVYWSSELFVENIGYTFNILNGNIYGGYINNGVRCLPVKGK